MEKTIMYDDLQVVAVVIDVFFLLFTMTGKRTSKNKFIDYTQVHVSFVVSADNVSTRTYIARGNRKLIVDNRWTLKNIYFIFVFQNQTTTSEDCQIMSLPKS